MVRTIYTLSFRIVKEFMHRMRFFLATFIVAAASPDFRQIKTFA